MKEISVAFISGKLKDGSESLKEGKFEDKQLYKFIDRAINDLKQKPTCGTKIPKNYGLKSIFKNMTLLIYGNMTCLMLGD